MMKQQPPEIRVKNFNEVNLGMSAEDAIKEASRCLQCKDPQCVKCCPVHIDIPSFINMIKENDPDKALEIIKKTNDLPAVCGRVCPQETQCEQACLLSKADKAIKIGHLERYAADNGKEKERSAIQNKDKKIAIIGSGPSGLTCAADLRSKGYKVTIFEALHKPGGVLVYGIPEFRLPKVIVHDEIDMIKELGVEIKTNQIIGKTLNFDSLLEQYDAVFLAVGAGLPYFLDIPGENLNNVYSSNEFLTRINLMKAYDKDYATPIKKAKKTVVIGAGNVAVDSARCARRLGSDVSIVYRRSEKEMPARIEEIEHAKEEGIKLQILTNPVKILEKEGYVSGIECIKMQLSEPDRSGRKRPIPVEGSNFNIECDQVIIAIGQGPNPLLIDKLDLEKDESGRLKVNDDMQTSDPKVFAGGDIIGGKSTVIKAMGDGKKTAQSIDKFLIK